MLPKYQKDKKRPKNKKKNKKSSKKNTKEDRLKRKDEIKALKCVREPKTILHPENRSNSTEPYTDACYFAQVREIYFNHLQQTIERNFKQCQKEDLSSAGSESISLQLEQKALIACMQTEVYQKVMTRIINEVKNSIQENKLYEKIKKHLPFINNDVPSEIVESQMTANLPVENQCRVPAVGLFNNVDPSTDIASRSEQIPDTLNEMTANLPVENQSRVHAVGLFNNVDPSTDIASRSEQIPDTLIDQVQDMDTSLDEIVTPYTPVDYFAAIPGEIYIPQPLEIPQPMMPSSTPNYFDVPGIHGNWYTNQNVVQISSKPMSRVPPQPLTEQDEVQTVDSSTDWYSLENDTGNEMESDMTCQDDLKKRDEIANILEGEDSLENMMFELCEGKMSDNDENSNEINENVQSNADLSNRLEKMKQIFGMDEDMKDTGREFIPRRKLTKESTQQTKQTQKRPTIWQHERIIHFYKYHKIASELMGIDCDKKRERLLELFGEDSDDEQAEEYASEDKYTTACIDRISPFVVKYLMPFYKKRRILGRPVFKCLARYIAETVIAKIQYPDEWTVKYFVSNFFPGKKMYACEFDVLGFQLDDVPKLYG